MRQVPEMLMRANNCRLVIESPHGPLIDVPIGAAVLMSKLSGGEIVKGVVDVTDEETGITTQHRFILKLEEF